MSGSGKSAVCEELTKRGYEVYEVDNQPSKDGVRLNPEWVQRLSEKAHDKMIFISGVRPRSEESAVAKLFDQVIFLTADTSTLKQRLTSRTNNDYGKDPNEQAKILEWAKQADGYHKQNNACMIDSTQPLDRVVEQVIVASK